MAVVKDAALVFLGCLISLLGSGLVVYAPQLRLGGGSETAMPLHTVIHARNPLIDTSELEAKVSRLEMENEGLAKRNMELQAAALSAGGTSQDSSGKDPTVLSIDLLKFFGAGAYTSGISYDPFVCFPDLKTVFPNISEFETAEVLKRASYDMATALGKLHGVSRDDIDVTKPYHMQDFMNGRYTAHQTYEDVLGSLSNDPKFKEWRLVVGRVMAPYMCDANGNLHVACPTQTGKQNPLTLGFQCRDMEDAPVIERLGVYNRAFDPIENIVRSINDGTCFTHARNGHPSFAHWVVEERMSEQWKTFETENMEQDKVVFLFDMLYEKMHTFLRQYWMGIITMQNPFDMYSIQDIIYENKPDLLIETGTANGGSACMWSSIMELSGLEDSKIITIDVMEPKWDAEATGWGGSVLAREDPTQNRFWKKRVTFLKGFSTEPAIVEKVKAAAANKKVMVTLDSGHHKELVLEEMLLFCPLVSVGQYCIVEDTKMSRWHSTGPLEAVREFLNHHPGEFEVDRARELLYTHHSMGYLKRIR